MSDGSDGGAFENSLKAAADGNSQPTEANDEVVTDERTVSSRVISTRKAYIVLILHRSRALF